MGIQERRNTEKTEMKRIIMDAAINIMEQDGYEKLSIRKIAAKIEYSPTTIYLYYKDKAEIITDMADELYGCVLNHAAVFQKENIMLPEDEQVRAILHIFIQVLCNKPEMVKAVMFSGLNVIFANNSADDKPSNSGIDLFDSLISGGIEKNIFKPVIQNASWMIISALLGFVMSSVANQLQLQDNFDLIADNFIEILIGGMK